jgi:hypothetical protein
LADSVKVYELPRYAILPAMSEKIEVAENDISQRNYEIRMRDHQKYQMVYFLLWVLEILLAFRFFLKLFGANPESFFTKLIYIFTGIFMFPFSGVFVRKAMPTSETVQKIFEPSIIVAMIVYALIAWGVGKLILIYKSKPKSDH